VGGSALCDDAPFVVDGVDDELIPRSKEQRGSVGKGRNDFDDGGVAGCDAGGNNLIGSRPEGCWCWCRCRWWSCRGCNRAQIKGSGVRNGDENSKVHPKSEQDRRSSGRRAASSSRIASVVVGWVDEVDPPKGDAWGVGVSISDANARQEAQIDASVAEARRIGEG
jgi:hypothetical protein